MRGLRLRGWDEKQTDADLTLLTLVAMHFWQTWFAHKTPPRWSGGGVNYFGGSLQSRLTAGLAMFFDKAEMVKMNLIVSILLHVHEPETSLAKKMYLMAVQ